MSSESNLPSGPRTPASGGERSPAPRKVWQVAQASTPAPLTVSPPPAKAPPSSDVRKPNPPTGPLNLELPPPAAANRPAAAQVLPVVVSPAPPNRPLAVNTPKAAEPEPEAPWEDLLQETDTLAPANGATPRAARHGPVSMTQRVGGLPPTASSRKLGWVIGIASILVVGFVIGGGIVAWIFSGGTKTAAPTRSEPAVYYVNPHGGKNASPSITAVLDRLRGKSNPAARIIVQGDIAESDVLLNVPHVSIEAEEGKTIHWRPLPKSNAPKLFAVYKAEDVRVKGFVLDGEGRLQFLVNLFERCSGSKLEDLKLQGFTRRGIWITNCEGGKGSNQRIEMNRLEFVTTDKSQTALYFTIEPGMSKEFPKNRYFTFGDCTFVGPGAKVKTSDLATLEDIEWPPNVQPIQGR